MQDILNKSNINEAHGRADNKYDSRFNCWGATLYALDIEQKLHWLSQDIIEQFLEDNTREIHINIKRGDILCLYDYDGLIHTAICISNNKFWHKMGGENSEYTTLEGVLGVYSDEYMEYKIRRLNERI